MQGLNGSEKSIFDPKFCQRPVCSPRRDGSFRTVGSILWLFVSELQPFSEEKKPAYAQKSLPPSLWGHCLSITALALSARGLDNYHPTPVAHMVQIPQDFLAVKMMFGTPFSFRWYAAASGRIAKDRAKKFSSCRIAHPSASGAWRCCAMFEKHEWSKHFCCCLFLLLMDRCAFKQNLIYTMIDE